MHWPARLFFVGALVLMLWVTISASLDRGVFVALEALWPDLWFRATLADAYCAFLTVYVWVAWRERTYLARLLWLLVFLGLGSIGIASYVLIELFRLGPSGAVAGLMRRRGEQDLPA